MIENKNIAIVSHDRRKKEMIEWAKYNAETLSKNHLICTGTTGKLIQDMLSEEGYDIEVECMLSGPLGGDAQIAAKIVEGNVDFTFFLIDDLNPQPHEADIQMLLRQCRVHNIPVACNRYSADLILTSTLWQDDTYVPTKPSYVEFDRVEEKLNNFINNVKPLDGEISKLIDDNLVELTTETFVDRLYKVNPNDYESNPPLKWTIKKLQTYSKKNKYDEYFDENEEYLFENFNLNDKNEYFYYSYYNIYCVLEEKFNLKDSDIKQVMTTLLEDVMKIKGITPPVLKSIEVLKLEDVMKIKGITPWFLWGCFFFVLEDVMKIKGITPSGGTILLKRSVGGRNENKGNNTKYL